MRVFWGGAQQVQAELQLLAQAVTGIGRPALGQGVDLHTAPIDPRQNVALVRQLAAQLAAQCVTFHPSDTRQIEAKLGKLRAALECLFLRKRLRTRRVHHQPQVAHALGLQRLFDGLDHLTRLGVVAQHITGVQRGAPGLGHVGQAQDAAHELRHSPNVFARRQRAQHIGKRAVPALLQRLLGDDGAHRALGGEQIDVLWRVQVVALGGFDGDLRLGQAQLHQIGLGVLGVDKARVAHVFAGALHLHQQYRADVAVGVALQRGSLVLQGVQPFQATGQTRLPVVPAAHVHMDGQLDHFGLVQVGAAHVDQDVGATALDRTHARCGRQFQHKTGVKAVYGGQRRLGVGVVALVNHHHGAQEPHHIAQRAFHNAALGGARLLLAGAPRRVGVQIGHGLQQVPVRFDIVLARRVAKHIAPVAKKAQRLLGLARGRGQHQQHHAQVRIGVDFGQRRVFLQHLHPARTRHAKHLVVGVVAVFQGLEGLLVNRLIGHHPQHQTRVALQIVREHPPHAGRSQQRFAPARRNLQAHIRNSAARAVKAAAVRLRGKRFWQLARVFEHAPGLFRKVARLAQHVFHALHGAQSTLRGFGLRLVLFELRQIAVQQLQRGALKGFELHRAHAGGVGGVAAGLPEYFAVAFYLRAKFLTQAGLPQRNVHALQEP